MRKADLAAALAEQAGSTRRKVEAPQPTSFIVETPRSTPYRQPGRVTLVPITAHFPREVRRQLKGLAFEQDRTMHDLLAEALNDLFSRHGKPEICPRDD